MLGNNHRKLPASRSSYLSIARSTCRNTGNCIFMAWPRRYFGPSREHYIRPSLCITPNLSRSYQDMDRDMDSNCLHCVLGLSRTHIHTEDILPQDQNLNIANSTAFRNLYEDSPLLIDCVATLFRGVNRTRLRERIHHSVCFILLHLGYILSQPSTDLP